MYMAQEQITREDLELFREQLMDDFKLLLSSKQTPQKREWLKSYEVRKILKISQGTLQNLRLNGSLTYTQIGNILFYSSHDIDQLMEHNKVGVSKHKRKL
jgi:hypothetical protein